MTGDIVVLGWWDKFGVSISQEEHDALPLVSLPAVIEALEWAMKRRDDTGGSQQPFSSLLAHLKQLTTPADAGGRVK